jgi:hypothetical protein
LNVGPVVPLVDFQRHILDFKLNGSEGPNEQWVS